MISEDNEKHETSTDELNEEADPTRYSVDLEDDIEHKLHPNFISVQKLVGWCVTGIFSLIAVITIGIILMNLDSQPIWLRFGLTVTSLLLAILLCWLAQCWHAIDYRYRSYRLNKYCIEIKKGVVWRKVFNVPRTRLQHIDVNSGPIERKYGLAHLVIHTAGTIGASVTLEGLDQDTAIQIRDLLVATRSDDAV